MCAGSNLRVRQWRVRTADGGKIGSTHTDFVTRGEHGMLQTRNDFLVLYLSADQVLELNHRGRASSITPRAHVVAGHFARANLRK